MQNLRINKWVIIALITVSMVLDQLASNMKSSAITIFNPKKHALVPYISNYFELEPVQESPEGRYLYLLINHYFLYMKVFSPYL